MNQKLTKVESFGSFNVLAIKGSPIPIKVSKKDKLED